MSARDAQDVIATLGKSYSTDILEAAEHPMSA